MAQSRERRNQRAKRKPQRTTPRRGPSARTIRIRRIVIAFLILLGLAGVLALQPPDDGPDGRPSDLEPSAALRPAR